MTRADENLGEDPPARGGFDQLGDGETVTLHGQAPRLAEGFDSPQQPTNISLELELDLNLDDFLPSLLTPSNDTHTYDQDTFDPYDTFDNINTPQTTAQAFNPTPPYEDAADSLFGDDDGSIDLNHMYEMETQTVHTPISQNSPAQMGGLFLPVPPQVPQSLIEQTPPREAPIEQAQFHESPCLIEQPQLEQFINSFQAPILHRYQNPAGSAADRARYKDTERLLDARSAELPVPSWHVKPDATTSAKIATFAATAQKQAKNSAFKRKPPKQKSAAPLTLEEAAAQQEAGKEAVKETARFAKSVAMQIYDEIIDRPELRTSSITNPTAGQNMNRSNAVSFLLHPDQYIPEFQGNPSDAFDLYEYAHKLFAVVKRVYSECYSHASEATKYRELLAQANEMLEAAKVELEKSDGPRSTQAKAEHGKLCKENRELKQINRDLVKYSNLSNYDKAEIERQGFREENARLSAKVKRLEKEMKVLKGGGQANLASDDAEELARLRIENTQLRAATQARGDENKALREHLERMTSHSNKTTTDLVTRFQGQVAALATENETLKRQNISLQIQLTSNPGIVNNSQLVSDPNAANIDEARFNNWWKNLSTNQKHCIVDVYCTVLDQGKQIETLRYQNQDLKQRLKDNKTAFTSYKVLHNPRQHLSSAGINAPNNTVQDFALTSTQPSQSVLITTVNNSGLPTSFPEPVTVLGPTQSRPADFAISASNPSKRARADDSDSNEVNLTNSGKRRRTLPDESQPPPPPLGEVIVIE